MERAYREDELVEATVIDSEGYIYGKVQSVSVTEQEVNLVVYESKADVRKIVDTDTLRMELVKNVRLPLGAKIQGLEPVEILSENVRKELGLKPGEPVANEHFEEYAKRLGISVPSRKVETERRESKGEINIEEIKAIKVSVIGTEIDQKVVKVILLNDAREALFRNIPIQEKVPYHGTETVKDKLVLDSDGVALGYIDSVVLFRNGPGIRVYSSKTSDGVDLKVLVRSLDNSGQPHVARLIRRYFSRDVVRREELEDFKRKAGLALTLPLESVLSKSIREILMDVPWDMISKIGDVVILRLTLMDLQSKGYFLK